MLLEKVDQDHGHKGTKTKQGSEASRVLAGCFATGTPLIDVRAIIEQVGAHAQSFRVVPHYDVFIEIVFEDWAAVEAVIEAFEERTTDVRLLELWATYYTKGVREWKHFHRLEFHRPAPHGKS